MSNRKQMEQEFLTAYDAYADAIFRYCLVRVYEREKAKDIVQDVFIRAWQQVLAGREVKNWRPFLYRVATNLIIDDYRKKREIVSLEVMMEKGLEPGHNEHEKTMNRIDGAQLLEMLGALEEIYRDAVYLRYVEDLSPREIAEIIGESENVVSVRVHRGLEKLRQIADHKNHNVK